MEIKFRLWKKNLKVRINSNGKSKVNRIGITNLLIKLKNIEILIIKK